ncbi:adenine nucleotide alpha hydrolases-like protein [Xylona heveae TC161]|uniref:Adenine nucleotide alpha hydrolases-like protein n=1 Tax=Xylona heveae (strain CBS 132557 / TC161) TaxID=1328760 RepID=A0A164ZKX1_XYLHT|nr:adenine nucleotide alpha hydrolases-like protein [Xylona heveae TC161]KZF19225.1 adenine nucleotide alpha hydrolases-like protein [Xylona heveae TC161]
MSLESALDEERQEILRLLGGAKNDGGHPPAEAPSLAHRHRGASPPGPRSPVRSMLDITGKSAAAARHASIAGSNVGASRPGTRTDPTSEYQFDPLPNTPNPAPKRGSQSKSGLPSAITDILQGHTDTSYRQGRGRHNSTAGISQHKSKSPSTRLGRSVSPRHSSLNTNSFNPMPTPGRYTLDDGKVVDMNSAYRRLSDAALRKSGGSLSSLARDRVRSDSGESLSPSGGVRLNKDIDADDDEAAVSSSDDSDDGSSGDEWDGDGRRGRKGRRDSDDTSKNTPAGMGNKAKNKTAKSLMAASDEERKRVASGYKVKSLLEPSVTITGPGGEKLTNKRPGVHPTTSFDMTASGASTPVTSDTEQDLTDIRRAQRMNIAMSKITSTPGSHRAIRTVIRGEFSKMQQEAEDGLRRQRTYLVATDLSDEAAHALEWTIGTVLRDGDTLLAFYAIDEEGATGKGGDLEGNQGVAIGEGALAVQDTAAVVGSLTADQSTSHLHALSPLGQAAHLAGGASSSPSTRNLSRPEQERFRAAEDISQRCIRLLRKTRLQVRVVVEVIHCKSPKHLITEVIDFIEPTLVVLGSRGRSALKGVLLGSFSNYIVTKSSVPVMVARKRLRKHSKYKKTNIRLSNNLTSPKGLAAAKID